MQTPPRRSIPNDLFVPNTPETPQNQMILNTPARILQAGSQDLTQLPISAVNMDDSQPQDYDDDDADEGEEQLTQRRRCTWAPKRKRERNTHIFTKENRAKKVLAFADSYGAACNLTAKESLHLFTHCHTSELMHNHSIDLICDSCQSAIGDHAPLIKDWLAPDDLAECFLSIEDLKHLGSDIKRCNACMGDIGRHLHAKTLAVIFKENDD